MNMNNGSKKSGILLTLRGIVYFLVFAVIFIGIFIMCRHHYDNVAVREGGTAPAPEEDGPALPESFALGENLYLFSAPVGVGGLSVNGYKTDELQGEIKPDASDWFKTPYTVYTVKDKPDYLIVSKDGRLFVYYISTAENPFTPKEAEDTSSDALTD